MRQETHVTILQAITKALKSATSRWEAVEPAFLHLPEGQVVVVHILHSGRQNLTKLNEPADITKHTLVLSVMSAQILGFFRFDGSTWELVHDLFDAINELQEDELPLFEEQLLERLLFEATVRSDLTKPVPEDMEEFFLHRVGNDQCISMAVTGGDFSLVPEHPLGRFTAPKGTVEMYWPAIEKEREITRATSEIKSHFADALAGLIISLAVEHDHDEHEEAPSEASGGPFSRLFGRRNKGSSEPAPGMGGSGFREKDGSNDDSLEGKPYATSGLAGTRKGQAASDIG